MTTVWGYYQSSLFSPSPFSCGYFSQAKIGLILMVGKIFLLSQLSLPKFVEEPTLWGTKWSHISHGIIFQLVKKTPFTCKNKIDIILHTFLYHVLGKRIHHPNSWLDITLSSGWKMMLWLTGSHKGLRFKKKADQGGKHQRNVLLMYLSQRAMTLLCEVLQITTFKILFSLGHRFKSSLKEFLKIWNIPKMFVTNLFQIM